MINQKLAWLLAIIILTASCKKSTIYSVTNDDVVIEVNPNYFLQAGLAENITKVIKTVPNRLTLECCKIVSNLRDGHAAMIGYAMDGYGLFEQLDDSGKESSDLDAIR